MSRRGALRCLLAAMLFGASAPAASVLAEDMAALTLAGLLYLGAALAVAPAVTRRPPQPHRHEATIHEHEHVHPGDQHHTHRHDPAFTGRHTHPHTHEPLEHAHPHMPDLHHHHPHGQGRRSATGSAPLGPERT